MRKNPMAWDESGDDAPAEGVLSPLERDPLAFDSAPSLLGVPGGESMLGLRRSNPLGEGAASGPVMAILDAIKSALVSVVTDNSASRIDLDTLSTDDLAVLKDALGSGEVSMILSRGDGDPGVAQTQDTALAGVWIGRVEATDGSASGHWLEVADVPIAVRRLAVTRQMKTLDISTMEPPRGAMNVMSVLSEVSERSEKWVPGDPCHVINFTLFPMSAQDAAFLSDTLGEVGVEIMSGGYGVARVVMTAVKHVWAVQYLNGMGTTILDTLEIGDVPECVLASTQDFEDSLHRLEDIRDAYQG